ncbi:hypothetical protein FPV67DRAFT_158211 [Lyophyllum atratum]|nr:hypothetical protein FPV67DRAFT_158211 [Lyophyllum atratum]
MSEKAAPTSLFAPVNRRRILYGVAWALLFAIAAAALGLVADQLQRGGNSYDNYGSMSFKHILGLTLFSSLLIFFMFIGHYFTSVTMMAFWTLIAAIFWGVDAGVIFQSCPYRAYNCHNKNPQSTFQGSKWGNPQFFSQCSKIVALQGLAWAEFGLLVLMFFGMLYQLLDVRMRPNTSFYRV